MTENILQNRDYHVNGRYGYFMVDMFRNGESESSGYALGPFHSRTLAVSVANALNAAYTAGREDELQYHLLTDTEPEQLPTHELVKLAYVKPETDPYEDGSWGKGGPGTHDYFSFAD